MEHIYVETRVKNSTQEEQRVFPGAQCVFTEIMGQ